jgi:hypothetical protein
MTGANLSGTLWGSTTCPDGTIGITNAGFTCIGHFS